MEVMLDAIIGRGEADVVAINFGKLSRQNCQDLGMGWTSTEWIWFSCDPPNRCCTQILIAHHWWQLLLADNKSFHYGLIFIDQFFAGVYSMDSPPPPPPPPNWNTTATAWPSSADDGSGSSENVETSSFGNTSADGIVKHENKTPYMFQKGDFINRTQIKHECGSIVDSVNPTTADDILPNAAKRHCTNMDMRGMNLAMAGGAISTTATEHLCSSDDVLAVNSTVAVGIDSSTVTKHPCGGDDGPDQDPVMADVILASPTKHFCSAEDGPGMNPAVTGGVSSLTDT